MRYVIDRSRCVSSAQCFIVAPDIFDLNEEGQPDLGEGTVAPDQQETVRRAADGCPMGAIIIVED